MIAHWLNMVQRCDRVVRVNHGAIVATGGPRIILSGNP